MFYFLDIARRITSCCSRYSSYSSYSCYSHHGTFYTHQIHHSVFDFGLDIDADARINIDAEQESISKRTNSNNRKWELQFVWLISIQLFFRVLLLLHIGFRSTSEFFDHLFAFMSISFDIMILIWKPNLLFILRLFAKYVFVSIFNCFFLPDY